MMLLAYSALTGVVYLGVFNAATALAANTSTIDLPANISTGFLQPQQDLSAGKGAVCTSGQVRVTATGSNTKILISAPTTNFAATELFVEFTQANSTTLSNGLGGPAVVQSTYSIYSRLCLPSNPTAARNVKTIQFLTHGGTLDHTYWDIASGYSYVDAAAAAGYATFSYDRLGTGLSDHPDPVQVVQLPIQIEIAHLLVQKLRNGQLGSRPYENIVGVGHSLGSALTQGVAAKYPVDFDALILQGISTLFSYAFTGVASEGMQIANTDPSGRFRGLANGYFTPAPVSQAVQFAFYRYPGFDPQILAQQFAIKQTNALGEMFTLGSAYAPASAFAGPIDIVNGQNDYFYCGGDCTYPTNQAAAVKPALFPAASRGSQFYLAPNAGHNVNAHYSAPQAFGQMLAFLRSNGIL